MKYAILDDIGDHFIDRAVQLVKSGYTFVYVMDNIDWEEKAHDMRKDVQNRSVHAVATSIVFDRVPCQHLSDSGPQEDIRKCDVNELVAIQDSELLAIRNRYKQIVGKMLLEHFPSFGKFKAHMPEAICHPHAVEMSTKLEVITMPILLKDEKKCSDCVDILDQLEKWTEEIYSAAGLCTSSKESANNTTPVIAAHSRPDQPASHIPPATSESDPLHGVKIPCYGDQLTRVRMAGSKDLRAGCHSAKQRLDHLYPFCIVDWHTKRSFLKVKCNSYVLLVFI